MSDSQRRADSFPQSSNPALASDVSNFLPEPAEGDPLALASAESSDGDPSEPEVFDEPPPPGWGLASYRDVVQPECCC